MQHRQQQSKPPLAWMSAALVLGTITWPATSPGAGVRADLDGVWNVTGSYSPDIALNAAGEARRQAYDFLTDDPHMQCLPTSVTRTMITPSPLMEIRQHDDHIEFNHEFMDVRRRIPLDDRMNARDAPVAAPEYPHLGPLGGALRGGEPGRRFHGYPCRRVFDLPVGRPPAVRT